ncbi:hypothetical protein CBR_g11002 [Chara braunii]|uniref:Uncharacterized protein n=1 Tax=Chara braunii TaxID=69332 RepID=A0A388KPY7_CHABU|nr:hypothetical protein CBR_g11002 [Chara braunii]|eukprot:GBG72068.1 hypothetical protein CBR_g11002 [Chara braunii]
MRVPHVVLSVLLALPWVKPLPPPWSEWCPVQAFSEARFGLNAAFTITDGSASQVPFATLVGRSSAILKRSSGCSWLPAQGKTRSVSIQGAVALPRFDHSARIIAPQGGAMGNPAKSASAILKLVPATMRPQRTDLVAAGTWGATAVIGAVWLVQPFDWVKSKLFPPPTKE